MGGIAVQEQITVSELVANLKAELKRVGYADSNTLLSCMGCAGCIAKYFNSQGLTRYDPAVKEEYIQMQRERNEKCEISGFYYRIRFQITGRKGRLYGLSRPPSRRNRATVMERKASPKS